MLVRPRQNPYNSALFFGHPLALHGRFCCATDSNLDDRSFHASFASGTRRFGAAARPSARPVRRLFRRSRKPNCSLDCPSGRWPPSRGQSARAVRSRRRGQIIAGLRWPSVTDSDLQLDSVLITTGADLARSLAHAVESIRVADHRTRHHRCDLLVIDDLHRLANKPAAQQFLISSLDSLLKRGTLVIVTLPKSAGAMTGFAPPLVSRLLGGLVVRLALPGPQARVEIVRQAATRSNIRLSNEEVDRLAGSGDLPADRYLSAPRIRQLVLRMAATPILVASHQKRPADRSEQDLKQFKAIGRRVTTLVAKHFGLPVGELKSKSRRQALADARGVAMHVVPA